DALGDLRKGDQVLRFEIESVIRSAKVKAPILHVALGILAQMPDTLDAAGYYTHGERRLPAARKPPDRMSALVGQTVRPVRRQAERVGKRFQRLLRRLSHDDNQIDQ